MAHRLEITLKDTLIDAEGEGIRRKAQDYFNLAIEGVRVIQVVTIDADLTTDQLDTIQSEVFTNPVTQVSSYQPLDIPFDGCIWVGYRPGVKDNPGDTAVEAVTDVLGVSFQPGEAIYTSKRYCLTGSNLTAADMDHVAGELLANDIIQQWRIYLPSKWSRKEGIGLILPKVVLNHRPTVNTLSVDSDAVLKELSDKRNLALNANDIPVVRAYFQDPAIQADRMNVGLADPTDIELEYISQARSDHCNHNTFRGRFRYVDSETGTEVIENNLFKTYIEAPTLALKEKKSWVVSVLWDNAGVGQFDKNHFYVITGETHNSPSNMEAYGGAITGIVGVYRDPLGTGKGARLIMGGYGYCVGPRDYSGPLHPQLTPRRLLDGVIEGVRDGGNKSGIPTTFGQVFFHPGYLGKCLVYVTAVGLMPATVDGSASHKKYTSPGELLIMCGGRVGKDGIHGVTASSESFSANTPAGHVQIGDPYTQKKMHDFLLEARDEGLIQFVTDNGGGGLSSSIGESARFSNGCEIDLEKVPLKYDGLDQWEIWISESQERMTLSILPEDLDRFMALSARHAVESTVIGHYTDSGKLHIRYENTTCAYVNMDFLESGFPHWEFDAVWQPPTRRGLSEPVLGQPSDYGRLVKEMLARPNIASTEWIARQYDHEVQGTSIIKPLVGADRDVNSDAAVIRPVLTSEKGLAFSQALLPMYSTIDAYHMTTCTIDEAVRRIIAVGGNPAHIGGVDNFCWPNIQFHPENNPDGKFKAAQLVRSCRALKEMCLAYEIPLLSGKDSMYVDGHLPGRYGETHKVSAPETMQFSAISVVEDINRCVTMDVKAAGDLVYILGMTRNELGGSEYYAHFGYTGLNVPGADPTEFKKMYQALYKAICQETVVSAHGIYAGGLCVHLAMIAMGGGLGVSVNLSQVPVTDVDRDDQILFSESAGRFLVTVDPANQTLFETVFNGLPFAVIGQVEEKTDLTIHGLKRGGKNGDPIVNLPVQQLKAAWKQPFGDLI
jgi:phosphoribosylformylglycinamidine synthase